jgi:DNA-binding NtrC family response regulator
MISLTDRNRLITSGPKLVAVPPAAPSPRPPCAYTYELGSNQIVVADAVMVTLYALLRRLARSDLAVLVTGETGSGKENAAAALHHWSPRASGPWVSLNCAALPDTLAESELFGYERGAFTEARGAKPGLLERAHGGTLFLDEVGDLSLPVQAKLLRAIETKRITRLGDVRDREVDVRIVAATNIDLDAAVRAQRFRQDLLFRLGGARVAIPALRERREEIPLLARRFVEIECAQAGRPHLEISRGALEQLSASDFPGNVRELKNAIAYAVAVAEGPAIEPGDLPSTMGYMSTPTRLAGPRLFRPLAQELRDLECRRIVEALEEFDGVQTRAAAALGMPLRTFTLRMRQYGLTGGRRRERPFEAIA